MAGAKIWISIDAYFLAFTASLLAFAMDTSSTSHHERDHAVLFHIVLPAGKLVGVGAWALLSNQPV